MIQQFLNHLSRHKLCETSDKILLAVSGGIDSMVMLDLFVKAGFKPAVAHCNFQLRGNDSAQDEEFVRQECQRHQVQFHVKRFDTLSIANETKESIQIAARNLRYGYFRELANEFGYERLATAHHLNDSLETVLINLVRGTGIEGIAGIPVRNDWIIRPLLFTGKEGIYEYAKENSIAWREDVSNAGDDYLRNIIRHEMFPMLESLNPSLIDTFQNTAERLGAANRMLKSAVDQIRNEIVTQRDGKIYIDQAKLKAYRDPHVIIWELLKDEGLNFQQACTLVEDHQPGRQILLERSRITVDRQYYILDSIGESTPETHTIEKGEGSVAGIFQSLTFSEVDVSSFKMEKRATRAQLDLEKLSFPLRWRKWHHGDALIPLGMKSHKKISDLLIDEKISLPDKEQITVLESGSDIVWVVGIRIHEHYKVTAATRKVLIIETLPR